MAGYISVSAACMWKLTQTVFCDPKLFGGTRVGYGKCGVRYFGGSNLRNHESYGLRHDRTLIGNHIWQIKWYHLWAHMTTISAQNRHRNLSNYIVFKV